MSPTTRHLCMIYEGNPAKPLSLIIPILADRLATRFRCMYFGSPVLIARVRVELAKIGFNTAEEIRKGSLILISDQNHLKNGEFDSDAMLSGLANAVDKALEDGYRGLWATGDMTWEFGSEKNLTKLLKYEFDLESTFIRKPALQGICQYHKDTLPLRALGDAMLSHSLVYLDHSLHKNRFYIPSEGRVDSKSPLQDRDIEWMLNHFEIA